MRRDRWGWGFTQGLGGAGGSPFLIFNGTTTAVNCGSGASLDDLHDAAFTAEGYFRSDSSGESGNGTLVGKVRWQMLHANNFMRVTLTCATTSIDLTYAFTPDEKWHHWGFTFDDAGDRKVYLYKDKVLVATSSAASGAVITDASDDLIIGNNSTGTRTFDGAMGWVRVSDVVRDIPNSTDTRTSPPASDANTALLLKMDEGTGTTAADSSGNANHGTITDGVWGRG